MESAEMKLKKKYLTPKIYGRHQYRTRTGPRCCNSGCPSTRKKLKNKNGPRLWDYNR